MLSINLTLATAAAVAATAAAPVASAAVFNSNGNVLIADQFNNRVIEIAPNGQIVWQFGKGPSDITRSSPLGVNDALRVGNNTLVSGTGVPPGAEPLCPQGCADNRVMIVNQDGAIIWQYGAFGVTGAGPDQLSAPVASTWTSSHTVLITDQGNQRVIEVGVDKRILWQYGITGVAGNGPDELNAPNSAEVLDNGDILIADENNNRAIVVDRGHRIVATYTAGGTLSGVAFASGLPNGHILITDGNNNRVVEVNASDKIVWSYVTNTQPGSNPAPLPSRAIRLRSGATIISDQFNHRVIVVDFAGDILQQWGTLNVPGYSPTSAKTLLNAPYDAKVIGDDTGLTWSDSLYPDWRP